MLTLITTLLAVVLALIGVWWLPDPQTRMRGLALLAGAVVLAVFSFRRVEKEWPRPVFHAAGGVRSRAGVWQIVGLTLALAGFVLTAWTLVDIWRQSFVWVQAWRWLGGLLLVVVGMYVRGGEGEEARRRGGEEAEARGSSVRDCHPSFPSPALG